MYFIVMYDDTSSPQTGRRSLPLSRQKFRSPALKMRIESILKPQPSSFLDDLQLVLYMYVWFNCLIVLVFVGLSIT